MKIIKQNIINKIVLFFLITITLGFSNINITELNKEIEELDFDTEKVLITVVGDNDYFFVSADNKIVEYKYNLRYFSDGKNNILFVRLPNKDVKSIDMVIKNNIFIEFNIDDLIEYDNDLFQIVYLNDDYELKKIIFDNLIRIKYYTNNKIMINMYKSKCKNKTPIELFKEIFSKIILDKLSIEEIACEDIIVTSYHKISKI